jgi:hypothetical protein
MPRNLGLVLRGGVERDNEGRRHLNGMVLLVGCSLSPSSAEAVVVHA